MADLIAPFPTTLSELRRHLLAASLSKCDFSDSCATNDNLFTTDTQRRAVSRRQISLLLPHAVNCGRFCFWRRQSVVSFLFVYQISGTAERICDKFTRNTCLVPRSNEFEGQGQRSRSPRTKTAFFGPLGGLRAVYFW